MKPTWALAGLCLLFLLAFFVQRSRSAVLTIEGERPLAERVAEQSDLTVAEVMSLRELLGANLSEAEVLEAAQELSEMREELPERLAILTVAGHEELARSLWEEAEKDPLQAVLLLRVRPENIVPTRFANMTKRFDERLPR